MTQRVSFSYTRENGEVVHLQDVDADADPKALYNALTGVPDAVKITIEPQPIKIDSPAKQALLWAIHNLIAHPISEITHWLAYIPGLHVLRDLGLKFHDKTVPRHAPGTGRG